MDGKVFATGHSFCCYLFPRGHKGFQVIGVLLEATDGWQCVVSTIYDEPASHSVHTVAPGQFSSQHLYTKIPPFLLLDHGLLNSSIALHVSGFFHERAVYL